MIGKQKSSIWKAPRMEQYETTCLTDQVKYNTRPAENQVLFHEEHICRLYNLTRTYCKDRLPETMPPQTCCHDCANSKCKRRCQNTKDKCGQAIFCKLVRYRAHNIEEEF